MPRPSSTTIEQFSPNLADLLVDQSLRTLGKGSSKKVWWRCPDHLNDERHVYPAVIGNKTVSDDPLRCNICIGKHVVAGINDVATTHPQAARLFTNPELAKTLTAQSNKRVEAWCKDPAHDHWNPPVSRLTVQGSGCPQCSGREAVTGQDDLATTHPDIAAMLVDPTRGRRVKAGSSSRKETWRCSETGHPEWNETPYAVVHAKIPCPTCGGRIVVPGVNDLATTHPLIAAQLVDPTLARCLTKGSPDIVDWRCQSDPAHVWPSTVHNRIKGSTCGICDSKRVLVGFNDIATRQPELVDLLKSPDDAHRYTPGTGTKLSWRCPVNPAHEWSATPSRLLSPRPTGCPDCFRENRSSGESMLAEVVRGLMPDQEIVVNDRKTLGNGQELDVVVPGLGLAFEFNGVYWHSEAQQSSTTYHRDKSLLAAEKGLRLVHVWEDDWFDRREVVVRGVAHRLGATARVLDVLPNADPMIASTAYARKLTFDEVDGAEARAFWTANHLRGPVGCSRNFALRDDHRRIRALLGVGRKNHGSRAMPSQGVWDVQRYATLGSVPGGFSRLLTRATTALRASEEAVSTWTSYSDNDVSDGGMYVAAGFVADKHQAPSYEYVGTRTGWRRSHRTNWTRKRFETDDELLYQPGWTEHEATLANKLYRIYDAGKTRWIKEV